MCTFSLSNPLFRANLTHSQTYGYARASDMRIHPLVYASMPAGTRYSQSLTVYNPYDVNVQVRLRLLHEHPIYLQSLLILHHILSSIIITSDP